jgi:hypothetical protein
MHAKYSIYENPTEVWVCNTDLTGHRKVYDTNCGNHNSVSATFIDNDRIMFRGTEDKVNYVHVLNVKTGILEYKVRGKEGHRAEGNKVPFSTNDAVFWLDCGTGEIKELFKAEQMVKAISDQGYEPHEKSGQLSHVQLNPSCTRVMMRIGVNGSGGALLGCYDMADDKFYFIPNKPVHQLWYDDDSYMAVYQLQEDGKWISAASRINRYSLTGEVLENLGGVGNHVDGTPDRRYFAGDSMYPGEDIHIYLYKKGVVEPIAVLDTQNFQKIAWGDKVHSNPSFSADGKRVYFNRPVSEEKSVAVFVDVSGYVE